MKYLPVEGASGGAIRKPWERIPTKLEIREPCHKRVSLPIFFAYLSFSPFLLTEYISRTLGL